MSTGCQAGLASYSPSRLSACEKSHVPSWTRFKTLQKQLINTDCVNIAELEKCDKRQIEIISSLKLCPHYSPPPLSLLRSLSLSITSFRLELRIYPHISLGFHAGDGLVFPPSARVIYQHHFLPFEVNYTARLAEESRETWVADKRFSN